jgi:Domian of unknown function (DUF4952)
MCCVIWYPLRLKQIVRMGSKASIQLMLAFFYRWRRTLPVLACAVCILHSSSGVAANPQCGDFLQTVARKPAQLQFAGCRLARSAQIAVLEASYFVEGRHATAVERYFMRHAAMQSLQYVCCGWEARPNRKGMRWGRLQSGYEFDLEVQMTSGETLIQSRRNWALIDRFEVTVVLPLESP